MNGPCASLNVAIAFSLPSFFMNSAARCTSSSASLVVAYGSAAAACPSAPRTAAARAAAGSFFMGVPPVGQCAGRGEGRRRSAGAGGVQAREVFAGERGRVLQRVRDATLPADREEGG